jgi:hypothetical protein
MRVLVVHSGLILTAGIEDFLARQEDLSVKGISTGDRSAMLKEIAVFQPSILILDERPTPGHLAVMFKQMKSETNSKIICVNKNNNKIVIYEKTEIVVTQASELIDLIRSSSLYLCAVERSYNGLD